MGVLRRKRMYEQQRDQLAGQAFNVEQTNFAIDSVKDTLTTVQAMKTASKTLKKEVKKVDLSQIEDLQDDLADMMEDVNDVQDVLGQSYGIGDDIDDADLDAELDVDDVRIFLQNLENDDKSTPQRVTAASGITPEDAQHGVGEASPSGPLSDCCQWVFECAGQGASSCHGVLTRCTRPACPARPARAAPRCATHVRSKFHRKRSRDSRCATPAPAFAESASDLTRAGWRPSQAPLLFGLGLTAAPARAGRSSVANCDFSVAR